MHTPKIEKEVRGFIGKLQYISRFIAKLDIIYDPIFKLLRKNQPVIWDEKCQQDFETIKDYLMNPSVLQPLRPGKILILYLSIEKEVIGVMLAQGVKEKWSMLTICHDPNPGVMTDAREWELL